ncbi:MAG: DUF262 domain-containing protein [Nitrososphaerota archaeon]|nr:DUF262 domain-containing protein [Nitrososphaerota archaeon]
MKSELSINELVSGADNDRFALPFFQRDYVWEKKDVTTFLDSISRGWPAGSIILWDNPRTKGRKFGSFKGNPKEVTTDMLVLDGQQRITTLLLLRHGGRIDMRGRYGKEIPTYFFYDLEDSEFIASREDKLDDGHYIDVENILRGRVNVWKIAKKYKRTQRQKAIIKDLRGLSEYKFPIIRTGVRTEEDAIDIFNRVNTTGKKVDKLELAFAYLRDKEHEVSRRITEFQNECSREGFDLTPRVLINSFLIILNLREENYMRTRNADTQIRDYLENSPAILTDWHNVFERIRNARRFLKLIGFDSDQFLTTENAIAVLAGFFERNGIKPYQLSITRRNRLRRWLFRTMLLGRYTYTTNFEKDLSELQDSGRLPEPSMRGQDYTDDGLIAVMYALGRLNHMTDFRGEEIAWEASIRTNRVIHVDHIYPYSQLTKDPISGVANGKAEELTDDIGNKAFAYGASNVSKNKKFPGDEARAGEQWMDGFTLLSERDYKRMKNSETSLRKGWSQIHDFIEERAERILRDIERAIE